MKISQGISKNVNNARRNYRNVLIESIIVLAKKLGAKNGDLVLITEKDLIIHQQEGDKTKSYVVNQIAFSDDTSIIGFYHDCEMRLTSPFISISNLEIIYNEIRKAVLRH